MRSVTEKLSPCCAVCDERTSMTAARRARKHPGPDGRACSGGGQPVAPIEVIAARRDARALRARRARLADNLAFATRAAQEQYRAADRAYAAAVTYEAQAVAAQADLEAFDARHGAAPPLLTPEPEPTEPA